MGITSCGPLAVCLLFMLLVVAMVLVDQILEFPDLILEVNCPYLGIVQLGIYRVSMMQRTLGGERSDL